MTASAPPSSPDAALARTVVSTLIDTCRDSEHAFQLAARSVAEPIVRAEFAQYSVQRGEFIIELQEAIHAMGADADDRGPLALGDQTRWDALAHAAADRDRAAMLDECEHFDLAALDAYRQALQAGLPYSISSVMNSHFLALTRLQSRLQCLADLARGSSPIDNS